MTANHGEVPAHFAALPIGNHEVYVGDREFHVAVREDDSGRYILAYDVENSEARERGNMRDALADASILRRNRDLLNAHVVSVGRETPRLEGLDLEFPLLAPTMDVHVGEDGHRASNESMTDNVCADDAP